MSQSDRGAFPDTPEIPFIDVKAPYRRLHGEINRRINAVLEHGNYVGGPEIDEFEAALAERAGAAHAVAVASGTDALLIALMADGIGPGDAVFVPAFTYAACASAVAIAGATPVFVDVLPDRFTLDPADLERRIAELSRDGGPTPRAVMPVDLFGVPADYPAIDEIARRHGLFVLADAAQSLGASVGATPVGALASVTATSFYPTKTLSAFGDGGALLTDDAERAARWREIRMHGFPAGAKVEAVRVGVNGRLDTIQAAVLLAKLTIFDDENLARDRLAELYDHGLGSLAREEAGGLVLPARPGNVRRAWPHYPILVDERDRLRAALGAAGIATAVYYPRPLHLHRAYRHLGPAPGTLPVAEDLCARVLSLPLHPYLDDGAVARVCAAVVAAL